MQKPTVNELPLISDLKRTIHHFKESFEERSNLDDFIIKDSCLESGHAITFHF